MARPGRRPGTRRARPGRGARRPDRQRTRRPAPARRPRRRRPRGRRGHRPSPSRSDGPPSRRRQQAVEHLTSLALAIEHTGRVADWMLDELAHAGQEHLDDGVRRRVRSARSQYDPEPDVDVLLRARPRSPTRRSSTSAPGPACSRWPSPRTAAASIAVDVSPAMVDVLRIATWRPAGLDNVEVVHGGLPHLRARRRGARVRVQPQRDAPGARLLEGHRPGPGRRACSPRTASCACAISCSTSSRPRLRRRDRGLAGRRGR